MQGLDWLILIIVATLACGALFYLCDKDKPHGSCRGGCKGCGGCSRFRDDAVRKQKEEK